MCTPWVCHPDVVETVLVTSSSLCRYCWDHLLTGCRSGIPLDDLLSGCNRLWRVNIESLTHSTILIHQAVSLYLANGCSVESLLLYIIAHHWVWWHVLGMLIRRVIECIDIWDHARVNCILCHRLHLASMFKVHSRMLQKVLCIFQLLLLLRKHRQHIPFWSTHNIARCHFRWCTVPSLICNTIWPL